MRVVLSIFFAYLFVGVIFYYQLRSGRPLEQKTSSEILSKIGNIGLDGTFRPRFVIFSSADLSLSCDLVHYVVGDGAGVAKSYWVTHGLTSSLRHLRRNIFLWKRPDGVALEFEMDGSRTSQFIGGSVSYKVTEVEEGGVSISGSDGKTWFYRAGLLVSMNHPALGNISYICDGERILEITYRERLHAALVDRVLMRVYYNNLGDLNRIEVGDVTGALLKWSGKGVLESWTLGDKGLASFHYESGLLERYQLPLQVEKHLIWETNSGWERGNSKWLNIVRLLEDGDFEYRYSIRSDGYHIHTKNMNSGKRINTVYDSVRRRVLQQDESKGWVFFLLDSK